MEPAGKIDPQTWMSAAETRSVFDALSADGAPARFVGGCVRDAVIGRAVKDIDIATPEPPDRVIALLKAAGIRAVPTGIDHGTVTAVTGGAHFEITTLRHDVETFGRHARVAFTDDWLADAARRDFTMNAVFCDLDGTLYDPEGGLDDLRKGRVRFVGEARARIEEDVLRLLRFFRFHAWYGRGTPDRRALAACRAFADRLPTLSAERVWSELRRILLAPDPAAILALMDENGVIEHLLPESRGHDGVAALVGLEGELDQPADAIRRLAAGIDGDAVEVSKRLRLSRADSRRLGDILSHRGETGPRDTLRARRLALHRLGVDLYRDLVLVDWAADGRDRSALWKMAEGWSPIKLPVRGADVTALGVPKGPEIGRLLMRIEDWWVKQDFKPDRAACLARLKRSIPRGKSS